MKKVYAWLGAAMLCAVAGSAHAERFDLSIGDDSYRIALNGPLSRVFSQTTGQYDIGAVVRPERDDDLLVAHVGALVTGDAGARSFDSAAGLGLRAVYIGRDDNPGGSIAPGGQFEARFPGYERIGFSVYGYYGPEVLTFGDFEEYYEVGTGVDYQVLRDASLYVGYRNINVKVEDGPRITADNGLHVGMRLSF
ncbi:YfaZ family outer membrane protein [Sinimarinibacterium flocculans]|uniref:YfaZ n=1 Tax=Sinimarinibacterium flocculans TaxID=985250 RepID=A0A318E969_9GAMM|nr:YfaZ family outer membrane protein [Sinimarinibacterium flocculans]PXV68567.1 YfaZ precursor [Sinimarinibacterium flocculans]